MIKGRTRRETRRAPQQRSIIVIHEENFLTEKSVSLFFLKKLITSFVDGGRVVWLCAHVHTSVKNVYLGSASHLVNSPLFSCSLLAYATSILVRMVVNIVIREFVLLNHV